MFMKKYSNAREHLDEALLISKKIGGYYNIARALGALGSLYFYLGDYDRSLEYLTDEVEICEECGNTLILITALYNLAETNVNRTDYATAHKQIAMASGYAEDRNDVLYEGMLTYLKARILYETGDYKTGAELNDKALPLIESMQWREGVFQSTLLKAKLLSLNDEEAAKTYLLSMAEEYKESEYTGYINYELYRINGDDEYRSVALKEFTELYENEGQSRTYKELIEELKKQEVL
jgi:tetratricopeptide (TPR) repeat protein